METTSTDQAIAAPVQPIVPMPFTPYYEYDGITIYNADCRKVLPWIEPVDLLLTDPPYGVGISQRGKVGTSKRGVVSEYEKSDWDSEPPKRWFVDLMRETAKWQIVFGGNLMELPPAKCWAIWHKDNTGVYSPVEMAWTNLDRTTAFKRWRWNGMIQENMGDKKESRVHPTQKPEAVMRWCLSLVPDAETVLDPFMGSGTTLVAARLEGRKAIGIEINERYCEAAANRLTQRTLF